MGETHGIEEATMRIHPLQKKGKKKEKKAGLFFLFCFFMFVVSFPRGILHLLIP